MQFWSEPQEPVLVEVCSGEWSPGSVKYVQEAQRALLASLGYEVGGVAKNFRRLVRINSVAAAEAAAREMLRIFYDALGYPSQWVLDVRLLRGERALGRTLGARVAREGTDWFNLRFVTPLDLAARMGAPFLVERGIGRVKVGILAGLQ